MCLPDAFIRSGGSRGRPDSELALSSAFLELVEDDSVQASTLPAGLVINALEGGSDDLEVLVSLKSVIHFCAIPHAQEERMDDAVKDGGCFELHVSVPLSNGESKLARGPDNKLCHCNISPRCIFVRGGQLDGGKNPGDPAEVGDAVAPHEDLLRGGESASDGRLLHDVIVLKRGATQACGRTGRPV